MSLERASSGQPTKSQDQPLDLTVHALPSLAQNPASASMGRLKMIGILLVCVAPVIASYFTYYVVRPEGRRNYGELINPQRPLPALQAVPVDARLPALLMTALKGQWLLISVAGGACGAACQQHLYLQRQMRESLGREKDRLDWLWLVSDDVPVPDALKPALREATVLRVPPAELSKWLEAASGHQLNEHLFLVDPLGNWMMRFPASMDAQGAGKAKSDLERLLRASNSWDNAGRT